MKNLMFAATAAVMLCAQCVQADFIRFTFSGPIEVVNGPISGPWDNVAVGDIFFVSYLFDTDAADSNGDATFGEYDGAIVDFSVMIESATGSTNAGNITVRNFVALDQYSADALLPGNFTAEVILTDLSAMVFDSDALPMTIDLDDFDIKEFQLLENGGPNLVGGPIESVEIVPAPGGAFLLLLSAGWPMAGRRRRTERKPNSRKARQQR